MNKFIKIFTMFFLITFSSTLYADAPGPINLSLKGIVDWVRFFQFVEYGSSLPSTPSTRGVWFILWVNNEPALYWSNGSEWIPFVSAGVQAGSVTTEALADGAVTTPKLANSAVTSEKLDNGSVTTYKIADNAVTGTKFANNSITTAKLANSAVTSEKLGYLSVGTNNIQNSAVTSEKIEPTIQNKNIVLNNGASSTPSLSFTSNHLSGLSYDGAENSVDVSISGLEKVKIKNTSADFINMPDGLTVSSFTENINLKSDGIHYQDDSLSITFDNNIVASGSLLPSEDITFNLGSNMNKWNNLYVGNIFSDNEYVVTTSLVPETDNTGYIGSDTLRWSQINAVNASYTNIESDYILIDNASISFNLTSDSILTDTLTASGSYFRNIYLTQSIVPTTYGQTVIGSSDKPFGGLWSDVVMSSYIYINRNTLSNRILITGDSMTIDGMSKDALKLQNSVVPSNNNSYYFGLENNRWKNIFANSLDVNNASVSQTLTVSNIVASETVESDIISANSVNVENNLEVKGVASVTSLLVNGAPLSGVENLKFPRGTLSVDIDCGKYSLRSLGKDLVLFSDAFMMIDYNITDDGNYFTFKSATASPAVMIMDNPVQNLSTITVRLDYENITLDSNLHYLLSIQNANGDYITSFYNNNSKFYMSFFNGNETLIDFNEAIYDWTEERNIYLTLDYSQVGYIDWTINIDGVDVYNQKTSVIGNATGTIDINSINVGDGNNGTYSISQDFNAKYRRIQIYPYELSLKEMISIPLFQPVADQQKELSKNITRCPYYTLGEPSTLIGGDFNEGEGFFGEVSGDKFIYGWEVLGQLWGMDMNVIDTKAKFIASFTEVFGSNISYTFTGDSYTELGVSDNLEVEWLKFYDNGYLIFIPKRPLLNNITWYEINNALGGYEGKEVQIPVNRINPIQTYTNKKSVGLICRMINGGNLQPMIIGNVYNRGQENNNLCMGSEWNRLMYRICDQIPSDTFAGALQGYYSGGKQFGDNWYNYTGSILGFGAGNDLGRVTWCREYCWYQNTLYCCRRSYDLGVGYVTCHAPSTRGNDRGFRPALVMKVSNQ